MRQPHQELVVWLVQNYPESAAAGSHDARFHTHANPEGYVKTKKLWLEHAKNHDQNVTILRNAARYFLLSDRDAAEDVLKKAQALEPDNADLAQQLGQLYKLGLSRGIAKQRRERAAKAMAQFEVAVRRDRGTPKNHHWLGDLATVAFEAGRIAESQKYAKQLLESSKEGKAVHDGNLVLGRIALRGGDLDKAKAHLLDAGKTSGGPTLNSFGPNMTLAKEILAKGEKETVLEYFRLCGTFWKNDKLQEWTDVVNRGGIPDFGGNLSY